MDIFRYLINLGDNYYQSTTESAWIKVLPVFLSGLLSFAITYFMFRHQNRVKEEEEKKRINDLTKYVYYCLRGVVKVIDIQTEALNNFIAGLQKDMDSGHVQNRNVEIAVGLNLEQIYKLNVNDTFKILVSDNSSDTENITNYQFLVGSGENLTRLSKYLDLINNLGGDAFDSCKQEMKKHHREFNEIIKDLNLTINNKNKEQDNFVFFNGIYDIWAGFVKNRSLALEELYFNLSNKIMTFCAEQAQIDPRIMSFNETRQMLTICQNINTSYGEAKLVKENQMDIAKTVLRNLEDINEVYSKINKTFKVKNISTNTA